jgi:hypothetical protein
MSATFRDYSRAQPWCTKISGCPNLGHDSCRRWRACPTTRSQLAVPHARWYFSTLRWEDAVLPILWRRTSTKEFSELPPSRRTRRLNFTAGIRSAVATNRRPGADEVVVSCISITFVVAVSPLFSIAAEVGDSSPASRGWHGGVYSDRPDGARGTNWSKH